MSYPLTGRICMGGSAKIWDSVRFPPESGWMATISKPRFHVIITLTTWGEKDWSHRSPAMTDQHFAIFDTAIGRCGIAWGPRGINAVQLPMSSEDKTRTRIRQRHGDIEEAPPPAEVQRAIDGIVELLAGKPNDLSEV